MNTHAHTPVVLAWVSDLPAARLPWVSEDWAACWTQPTQAGALVVHAVLLLCHSHKLLAGRLLKPELSAPAEKHATVWV